MLTVQQWYFIFTCLVTCVLLVYVMQITQLISCCSACRLPRWPPSSLCFPVRTPISITIKCFFFPGFFFIFRCTFDGPCSEEPQRFGSQMSARSPSLYKQHKSCQGVGRADQASRSLVPEPTEEERRLKFRFSHHDFQPKFGKRKQRCLCWISTVSL